MGGGWERAGKEGEGRSRGRVHERGEKMLRGGRDPASLTPTSHRTGPAVGGAVQGAGAIRPGTGWELQAARI